MIYYLIILLHLINFTFGFIALVIFSRRFSPVSRIIHKSFIQQTLFFNITLMLAVIYDYLTVIGWNEISNNRTALTIIYLLMIFNLGIVLLWFGSFVLMIYRFLERRIHPNLYPIVTFGAATTASIFIYLIIFSGIQFTPYFFWVLTVAISYSVLLILTFYSIFLYKKSTLIENANKRKSLRIFSVMSIMFFLCSICHYISSYPLQIFSPAAVKLSFGILKLLFNAFLFFWAFKYFGLLCTSSQTFDLQNVSEDEVVLKFSITKREREVIHLVCLGKSNQEIADQLFISEGTVKNHLFNIYAKVGIKNRTQLANMFSEHGMLSPGKAN